MMHGFTKGVIVDVLYLKINEFFEVNPPYGQSDFTVNPGPTNKIDCEIISSERLKSIFKLLQNLILVPRGTIFM